MRLHSIRQMTRIALAAAVLGWGAVSSAQQRVSSFDTHVILNEDDSALVREVIVIESTGEPIKQGVYRNIKTLALVGRLKAETEVKLDILSVTHNGEPFEYDSQFGKGLARLQFSPKDQPVEPGRHTLVLEYRIGQQVRFGETRDTFKWNVNGYDWWLPIDYVGLTITLPEGVPRGTIKREGRTGLETEPEDNYAASVDPETGNVHFQAASLPELAALVAEIEFDHGYIQPLGVEPEKTLWQKTRWALMAAGAGVAALLLYWVAAWGVFARYTAPRAGRRPVATPPMGLSAPCLRYVFLGTYDQRSIAGGFIAVGSKRCLRVSLEDGLYVLQRMSHSEDALAPFEERLINLMDYNAAPLERWDQTVVNDPT
ncbi:MAG: DUF2207 domain-containing protein, partial [Planctomycetota bacterium]